MKVRGFITSLSKATRAGDWRFSFVPFIIGCVYLWVLGFEIEFSGGALIFLLFSLCTTFGFAALGYYINEFFDRDSDRRAGKPNRLDLLSPVLRLLLLLVILCLTFLPWLHLPVGPYTPALIGLEVGLFLLYSLPFPRLKEKPFLSGIVDASYAYVVPLLLSVYTYSLYAIVQPNLFLLLFLVSVFFIGVRNITIHHINDVFSDLRSGNPTLPQKLGPVRTNVLLRLLFVAEFMFFTLFFVWSALQYALFWLWVAIYVGYVATGLWRARKDLMGPYLGIAPVRHTPDRAYQVIFPLLMLSFLWLEDWRWLALLPFHALLLLPSFSWDKAKEAFHWIAGKLLVYVVIPLRIAGNYAIYVFFRILGVDLVKEKKSALGFLKSKFGK